MRAYENCNADGTLADDYEYIPDEENRPEVPVTWYYIWGILHLFMSVWGVILYLWYPYYINNNSWFKLQCPSTKWT